MSSTSDPATVVSLCTGTGQLERALQLAGVDTRVIAVADPGPAASLLLAHHYPDVPNLGDITAVRWTSHGPVPAVDWAAYAGCTVVCAGWPCQPWSLAGQQKGENDERAIWPAVAYAIRRLRPRFVFLENVPGVVAAGELARVVADLAAIGYVGSWRCVRASDVGAAHRRERVFILAWQAGDSPAGLGLATAGSGGRGGDGAVLMPTPRASTGGASPGRDMGNADRGTNLAAAVILLPTPRATDTGTEGRRASEGFRPPLSQVVLPLLKTPTAQLAINGGSQHPDKRKAGGHGPTLADQVEHLLPTPTVANANGNGYNNAGALLLPGVAQHVAATGRWGDFAPAITRWEAVMGRPAPDPTEPGKTGQRLSTRFTEWLMGHLDGWVTGVPGLTRNQILALCGNGVVALQGAYAAHLLAADYPREVNIA